MFLFGLNACHKCQDPSSSACSNYNPCYGRHATSASFKIYETGDPASGHYIHWINYPVKDTTTLDPAFLADDSTALGYTWLVGNGVYHGHSLSLNNYPRNQWINVTLIIQCTPDRQCFPADDGIDTLVRRFIIVPFHNNFNHTFRGVLDEARDDSFNVSFNFHTILPGDWKYGLPGDSTFSFYNQRQSCTDTLEPGSITGMTLHEFSYEDLSPLDRCINKPIGRAVLDSTDVNRITYEYNSYYSYSPNQANHIFRGYRIN